MEISPEIPVIVIFPEMLSLISGSSQNFPGISPELLKKSGDSYRFFFQFRKIFFLCTENLRNLIRNFLKNFLRNFLLEVAFGDPSKFPSVVPSKLRSEFHSKVTSRKFLQEFSTEFLPEFST